MHTFSGYLRRHHVGLLALFIALGGTSYAAVGLARNSVGAAEIQRAAVRSAEVKDRSLMARDFRRGQLPRGRRGAPGPAGPAGPEGAVGPAGPPGVSAEEAEVPAARVRRTSDTQVVPTAAGPGSATVVAFPDPTAEQYDIGGLFDPAANTVLTVPVSGTYVLTAAVRWAANPDGVRNLYLHGPTSMTGQGGIRASSSVPANPTVGDTTRQSVATTERLEAGDQVFISVSQTSGGDLALDASQNQIHLSAAFLGP
jgi:hypothetical protein